MRRLLCIALLITVPSLLGCRQTASPTGAGPLTPIGPLAPTGTPGALSPVTQAPSLGPFGGPTRVTPPATGSFSSPNNYIGNAVPADQANLGVRGTVAPQVGAIGSGVRPAGWTETNSVLAPGAPVAAPVNPSAPNPRSGGMQVIDLTGAPPPPGYRPSIPQNFNNQSSVAPPVQNQPWQGQSFQSQPPQSQPIPNQRLQPVNTPRPQIASTLGPAPGFTERSISNSPTRVDFPTTAPATGPSTEPVNASSGSSDNLPWRRPGARF